MPALPALRQKHVEDAVEWIERNGTFDPWESNARYVGGFSHPKGFHSDRPRNVSGDFVVGACPDFDDLTARLLKMRECKRLIDDTRNHRIVYWNRRKVKTPPRLQPEVIEECDDLLMTSVQQALAGPRRSSEAWVDQPVWKLVGLIYRDHLNARNRSVATRMGQTTVLDENAHFVADESDLWRVRTRRV